MPLKPGPKPIADSTGKPDQRRRDNKETPGNTKDLKPAVKKKQIYLISEQDSIREYLALNAVKDALDRRYKKKGE